MLGYIPGVKALTFDVFGTVVDWRNSIAKEVSLVGKTKGIEANWEQFADDWRGGYEPAMHRVRKGELPWTPIDTLHIMILDELLDKYGLSTLSEPDKDHLNRAWHRLEPWADAVTGLENLKSHFIVAALSNGNIALLTNMAKHASLPWDCILSAELSKHYKPDPEVYETAAELLGLPTQAVMMVAAHKHDLNGAKATGMRTAYVPRPEEFGQKHVLEVASDPAYDIFAVDFLDLFRKLTHVGTS